MNECIRIENIDQYTLTFRDNTLVLTPIEERPQLITSVEEFRRDHDVTSSKIESCTIHTKHGEIVSVSKLGYFPILKSIWRTMPVPKIFQNTRFNIKLTHEDTLGYVWDDTLKMSVQCKDANESLKEIMEMILLNNYTLDMYIRLKTKTRINIQL